MFSTWLCYSSIVLLTILPLADGFSVNSLAPRKTFRRRPSLISSAVQPSPASQDATADDEDVTFESLGLSRDVLSSVYAQPGWNVPTPIQRLAIPQLLDDTTASVWCEAPTGSGKTAAYVLPLLERLKNKKSYNTGRIVSLVLCPTRELCQQITSVVKSLSKNVGKWNIVTIHGGVPLEPQIVQLANAVRDGATIDVLIATPGRLYDVLTHYNDDNDTTRAAAMERKLLDALDSKSKRDSSLSLTQLEELKLDELEDGGRASMKQLLEGLECLILDEADRLLGRGFESELDNLLALLPCYETSLQTWLFSATFPKQIEPRVDHVLKRVSGNDVAPVRISCTASDRIVEDAISAQLRKKLDRVHVHKSPKLEQVGPASTIQLRTIRLEQPYRTQALRRLLEENDDWDRVLVFVATRYASQHVAQKLRRVGIDSTELHGKLDQQTRSKRLSAFRRGKVRVLLATDVASRGLDVVGLPAVVNYDLPRSTADFVHRVGRTGRAGRRGTAVTFVTPVNESHLDLIEKRHLAEPVEREVLPGLEPNEEEWQVKSEAARISAPGTQHSSLGLAHDRMHGGIKGRRKSKKDRLREKAAREAAATGKKQES